MDVVAVSVIDGSSFGKFSFTVDKIILLLVCNLYY